MKITKKTIAEIARFTKSLHPEGLGNTLHFYLECDGTLSTHEDVSGRESYPGEDGEYLLSARCPLTQADVREIIAYNERMAREYEADCAALSL